MQAFARDLITRHDVGVAWPTFVGRARLGESFAVETVEVGANGPVEIEGVRAGDVLAIHIEIIEVEPPFKAPNGGPFSDGRPVPIGYRDGYFVWPEYFRLKAQPSVGSVAVLPEPTGEILEAAREIVLPDGRRFPHQRGWRRVVRDPRGKHCHQDCRAIGVGATVHMKAQVDGAGLCLEDVHGYIGQGELAFAAIETNARVQVRVERSTGWHVDWPLIETPDEVMVFSSYTSTFPKRPVMRYVDVVRQAYRSMCEVVAARIGGTPPSAPT
jgi:acetamidase/formamidase